MKVIVKSFEITSNGAKKTQAIGEKLGKLAAVGDIILLQGDLGVGKTCLTQGIAHGLDITENVISPTFVLVREYRGRLPLYHIDLYRLDFLEEMADLGLDDYFDGGGVCVVEWANKGFDILPMEHLLIEIEHISAMKRKLIFVPKGQRYEELIVQMGL